MIHFSKPKNGVRNYKCRFVHLCRLLYLYECNHTFLKPCWVLRVRLFVTTCLYGNLQEADDWIEAATSGRTKNPLDALLEDISRDYNTAEGLSNKMDMLFDLLDTDVKECITFPKMSEVSEVRGL